MLKMRKTTPNEGKGYILRLRQSRTFRGVSMTLALSLIFEMIQPSVSMALTEGPSQPEVQSFEPIGTTQMVDLFTGDFNYNIPLFNLPGPNGGYPVNMAYHAGVSMDDEASWVGLGWNINPGALVRNMRGLPDEFKSVEKNNRVADLSYDHLLVQSDMKKSWTLGVNAGFQLGLAGGDLPVNLQTGIYYNSFRGMGMSRGQSFGIGGEDGNFSLGFSLDSENGLGVSATMSHKSAENDSKVSHRLGLNFDGNLSLSYGLSQSKEAEERYQTTAKGKNVDVLNTNSSSYSSSFSFARASFTTSYAQNVNFYSLNAGVGFGATAPPWLNSLGSVSLNYSTQDFSQLDKNGRPTLVVGYDQLGSTGYSDKYTRDFSRGIDGLLTKESIMLSPAEYSYDTYVSTGQGLSGFFRPRRNDIGRVFDVKKMNESAGANFFYTVGTGISTPVEGSGGGNFGWERQGPWNYRNDLSQDGEFLNPTPYGIDENLYYQAHGEPTIMKANELAFLDDLDRANVKLKSKSGDGLTGGKRKIDPAVAFDNDGHDLSKRFTRNTLIHELKNKEVGELGEFNIKFYDADLNSDLTTPPDQTLKRDKRGDVNIGNHKAGFKVLNEEGSYYVYGLPAYNLKEVDNLFSVDLYDADIINSENIQGLPGSIDPSFVNTLSYDQSGGEVDYKVAKSHKYINKTSKSPYAHSYLLTSVQGADYVDIDNDGPTDDDLGYWVKFDYVKSSDDYQWRAPYGSDEAKYNRGATYTTADDKASYKYGEKELWYLGRMETKSHIAIFITSPRTDNQEAAGEISSVPTSNGDSGFKLDRIEVYEKKSFNDPSSDPVPLQTIHFTYADPTEGQLCMDAPNSSDGKLTLKSVHFTSLGSTRGEKSKYEFDYAGLNLLPGQNMSGINPSYNDGSYDSWGMYKPLSSIYSENDFDFYSHFPYTNQFNQGPTWNPELTYDSNLANDAEESKQMQDEFASAWCLNRIKLPSGGVIKIDYESDDYGYVQHKTANQMFKITSVNDKTIGVNALYENSVNNSYYNDDTSRDDELRRRIWFKLEDSFSGGTKDGAMHVYEHYVKPMMQDESGRRNLYFKSKMKLVDDIEDYVSGYLPLEEPRYQQLLNTDGLEKFNFGVSPDGTKGFITIKPALKKLKNNGNPAYFSRFHPMALAAWTFLQTNAQELLNNPNSFNPDAIDETNWKGKAIDMMNVLPQLASSLGAIRTYCQGKGMAQFIDLDKSCIRLASPDKIKYGGGHRVREISISDNWSSDTPENDRVYGQHYEYTIKEDGEDISSGVAQYEPQAGGDENALKYPIHFQGKSNVFTRNNLFAEGPINESLFPGASVGYRQVDVTSINTNDQRNKLAISDPNDPASGRTGGLTRHEFFTAKEFPTMWSYSKLSENLDTKSTFNLPIILPLVGEIRRNYFYGTQAFLIETNDMHGKPKSVKSYELNDFEVNESPITETVYEYQSKPITFQGETVNKLDNHVQVIPNDGLHQIDNGEDYLMGVEVDLFTDQRESKNFSNSFKLDIGLEPLTAYPLVTLPEFWISFSNVKSMFRTYTTNKVIHRSGILKKTYSRDLQTVNESEVLAYDEESGTPLLSKVKNEFGDDFYSYNVPAYYHYDRMGHAYRNINFSFNALAVDYSADEKRSATVSILASSEMKSHLVRGDELLITDIGNGSTGSAIEQLFRKAYFLGWTYNNGNTYAKIQITEEAVIGSGTADYTFKVIRSGRRNHHSTMAANYLTKGELKENIVRQNPQDPNSSPILTTINPSAPSDQQIAQQSYDNVLSATASLFKDDWATTANLNMNDDGSTPNPFKSGNSGIFRPYKSYTYVGERLGTESMDDNTSADPKLYEDGVMNNVPLFTWDLGNIENYDLDWEWVNEVTRFSPDAYEIENMNRLGIYSSALYGYDNSLTIAVGGNASVHELGVCDFETSGITTGLNEEFTRLLSQTNMNFDNNHFSSSDPGAIMLEQHNVTFASMNGSNQLTITTDIDATGFNINDYQTNVGLTLNSQKSTMTNPSRVNEGFYFNGTRSGAVSVNSDNKIQLTVEPYIDNENETHNMVEVNTIYTGKISMLVSRNYVDSPLQSDVEYVANKAHTGKKSMKVNAISTFDQPQLKLIRDKKYVMSFWVSKDNTKVPTYQPGKYGNSASEFYQLGRMAGSTFIQSNIFIEKTTYSKVIEGWQKVDIEFYSTMDNPILTLKYAPLSGESLYVDDIRFSPKTGGITTYVYDPSRFWLRASLNVDNYATFFYYDEEGNLTIKEQETEEGIYTITESRGHVSE